MALRIMVVDDDPEALALIEAILEPLGAEVVTLADSREAAERLKRERFDSIFVDVRMPHLDGFEMTRRIRDSKVNAGIPIVMVTGSDDVETMREGFKAGVTFFLGKPIDPAKVRGLFNAARGAILRERRRHARLPFRATIDCKFDKHRFKAESLNLGANGMVLEPSGGLVQGQVLDLEFTLPTATRRLQLTGKVLRREPRDAIAVEFIHLSPDDKAALSEYFSGLEKG